ncbi:MAG: right-handed parallel beta-helix repeat-containing protein [Planctomycetes bacterium]|nr:right-handed parallel beta-helix repeat-containing protein [Planctomycetota bacterium]
MSFPAFALLMVLAFLALPRRDATVTTSGAAVQMRAQRVALGPTVPAGEVYVADYLPSGYVTDGSVDYRAEVQRALDAAGNGTLRLPAVPLRVDAPTGQNWALIVRTGLKLVGSPGSVLVAGTPAVQVLRAENVEGLVLAGFTVRGKGGDGLGLAHGLVQVTGGRAVRVRDVTVLDSDADGIALSGLRDASVEGCVVLGASKSAIYLNACESGRVTGNLVRDFGGQQLFGGKVVGAGIQLSSCTDVVCSDNVVTDGVGIGLLCNALVGGAAPRGNVLASNRIARVDNVTTPDVSGGIRLANGAPDKSTLTLVEGNSIQRCGRFGLYVENHGASAVLDNLVTESTHCGLVVSTIDDLQVVGNVLLGNDTSHTGGQASIYLLNGARRVRCEGNVTSAPPLLAGLPTSSPCATSRAAATTTSSRRSPMAPRRPVRHLAARRDGLQHAAFERRAAGLGVRDGGDAGGVERAGAGEVEAEARFARWQASSVRARARHATSSPRWTRSSLVRTRPSQRHRVRATATLRAAPLATGRALATLAPRSLVEPRTRL